MQAKPLGIIEGVDPSPVDDLPLPHREPQEVEREDGDRIEPPLADPSLVEMAEAGKGPGEEGRLVGVAQRDLMVGHGSQSRKGCRSRVAGCAINAGGARAGQGSMITEAASPSPPRSSLADSAAPSRKSVQRPT